MNNWCTTDYVFEGDLQSVQKLSRALVKLLKQDRGEMTDDLTTHSDWVGYIAREMLKMDVAADDCDGTFFCIEDEMITENGDKSAVTFFTSTAWDDENAAFAALAKKYNLKMYYLAFEPTAHIFESNDGSRRHFQQKFFLETPKGGELFKTEKEVFAKLTELTGETPRKNEPAADFCKRLSTEAKVFTLLACKTVKDEVEG